MGSANATFVLCHHPCNFKPYIWTQIILVLDLYSLPIGDCRVWRLAAAKNKLVRFFNFQRILTRVRCQRHHHNYPIEIHFLVSFSNYYNFPFSRLTSFLKIIVHMFGNHQNINFFHSHHRFLFSWLGTHQDAIIAVKRQNLIRGFYFVR